jgi:hypothetical protein
MGDTQSSSQDALNNLIAAENQPATASPGQGSESAQVANAIGAQALSAANAGQLRVNLDEGQNLLNAFNNEINNLRGLDVYVRQIGSTTKLGQTPHAAAFVQFNEDVAVTGPHAFAPNHDLTIHALVQLAQATQIAMDNYRRTEQDNHHRFRG